VANLAGWRSALVSNRTIEQAAAGLSELRAAKYEVAVDFQGAVRSALIARWSGAQVVYGVAQARENAASMFYTRQAIASGTHIVEQNFSLAQAVAGRKLAMPKVQFPYDEAAETKCDRLLETHQATRFAVLNPGAGWGAKQWPAERYGMVARRLAEDGLKSFVNFGPGEEQLSRATETASANAATGVTCTISELISLMRRASLFVGGDTGPLHLAAALGVPVVAIFGPTNPARNGPWGTASLVLRNAASRTSHARRSQPDEGLLEISVDEVVAAARQLMESVHA
jgi:heptosyltransferase-1